MDDFYNKRKFLRICVNPLNVKHIWLNERLFSVEALLKQYADDLNLITATKNCNISFLCKVGDREISDPVKTIKKNQQPQRINNKRNFAAESPVDKALASYANLSL